MAWTGPTDCGLPRAVKIEAIYAENYRTKTFVLDAKLDAYPGQFVMAWLPRFDEKPFSLVDADPVTLMVTAVGPFSTLLHTLQAGDPIWLRGPFGHGFHVAPEQRAIALVGGGYGVAPLHWLARVHRHAVDRIHPIIGARTGADVLYARRFSDLDIAPLVTTEDGTMGQLGRVTDMLAPLLAAGEVDGIYACGPHGMLAALETLGQQHNVPCQLSWEAYMRCGIGICGACEHQGQVLCLDGPVLASGVTLPTDVA